MRKLTASDAYDIGFMRKDRELTRTYNIALWFSCIMLVLALIVVCVSTAGTSDDPEKVYESPDGQTLVISQDSGHILLNDETIFVPQDNVVKENDIGTISGVILGFVLMLIGLGVAVYITSYYILGKRKQAGWDMVKSIEIQEE